MEAQKQISDLCDALKKATPFLTKPLDFMKSIEEKVDLLIEKNNNHVKNFDSHVEKMDDHVKNFDSHVEKMDDHVKNFDSHVENFNKHVEKMDDHVKNFDRHADKLKKIDDKLNKFIEKFDQGFASQTTYVDKNMSIRLFNSKLNDPLDEIRLIKIKRKRIPVGIANVKQFRDLSNDNINKFLDYYGLEKEDDPKKNHINLAIFLGISKLAI